MCVFGSLCQLTPCIPYYPIFYKDQGQRVQETHVVVLTFTFPSVHSNDYLPYPMHLSLSLSLSLPLCLCLTLSLSQSLDLSLSSVPDHE